MKQKNDSVETLKKKNEKLKQMYETERIKTAGYEEVIRIYAAYISIFLNKLGATTEDKSIKINKSGITEAMERYQARVNAISEDDFGLYCVENS